MKKVNTKIKVIALSAAIVMTTAIYFKSEKITNAEQYAQTTDNAIELNIDKQDRDTIKLYLSNFKDIAKSLQLSVKIEGNAKFTEEAINWLVKVEGADLKTEFKLSEDQKQLDIFIVSNSNIEIDGGVLEICEVKVAKENINSIAGYNVVPNISEEGVSYTYVINETNKYIKGSDIVNANTDKLTINTAPVISLINSEKIVEGKIVIRTGEVFNALNYIEVDDAEDGKITNIKTDSNVNNKKAGTYKVTYLATDSEGDTSTMEVNVIVEDAKQEISKPVINILSKNIQIRQGEEFDPLEGVTATDYQGRSLEIKVTGDYQVEVVGKYELTYTVIDSYGNTVTENVMLEVVKQNAPIIKGAQEVIEVKVGGDFDPLAGITALDFEGNVLEVIISGEYDVNVPGEYIITYKAVDRFGTEAEEINTILKVMENKEDNQVPDNSEEEEVPDKDEGNETPEDDDKEEISGDSEEDVRDEESDSNIDESISNNDSINNENNNSTINEGGIVEEDNSNTSKIPTTGAKVASYIIAGIGAIIIVIGAYLFKKKK